MVRSALSLFFSSFLLLTTNGQCISTFPYFTDLELNNGNWVSGGSGNDWAWGAVSKTVISQAASGSNCWVTGGLTTSFYNLGQRSYIQSPCFDFSLVPYPYISFKIYIESERTYDGSNLQYSINNGTTWINVGAVGDAINCLNDNWYNTPNITNLGTMANPREGWAGNIQPTQGSCVGGGGSNGWILAKHCMTYLAGQLNVIFRFTFGAGTACNSYDGIAIDDITISNAPPNTADFNFSCSNNIFSFSGITSQCPDTLFWNFGDPASGTGNFAMGLNATHTYSAPGTYNVVFTVRGPCNAPATITKQVRVLSVSASSLPAGCAGANDGIAYVNSPESGFSYVWNTSPNQTNDTAVNLVAGTYTVTVTSANTCAATASVVVSEPQPVGGSFVVSPDTCGLGKGGIAITGNGGTSPYFYTWSNGVSGTNELSNLNTGNYTVTIDDANGCSFSVTINVPVSSGISLQVASLNPPLCNGGSDGSLTITANGGTPPYSYVWTPNVSTTATASNLSAGTYQVSVDDASNCPATINITLTEPAALSVQSAVIHTTCGNENGQINLTVAGGTPPYLYEWSNGVTISSLNNLSAGSYSYTVNDANNCSVSGNEFISSSALVSFTTTTTSDTCLVGKGSISIVVLTGEAPFNYSWNPAAPNQAVITQLPQGNYFLTVTDADGCIADTIIVVSNYGDIPVPNLGADTAICFQQTIVLSPGTFQSYRWGNGEISSTVSVNSQGSYSVTVTNSFGCTGVDVISIFSNCPSYIYFPTAFSPNGDGENDFFRPKYSTDLKYFTIQVYNRWGELLFESNDVNTGWDGVFQNIEQPLGVYVWMSAYSFESTKVIRQSGNVTLMR